MVKKRRQKIREKNSGWWKNCSTLRKKKVKTHRKGLQGKTADDARHHWKGFPWREAGDDPEPGSRPIGELNKNLGPCGRKRQASSRNRVIKKRVTAPEI